eukprot:82503-Chlamydomonas_euryale.AAC.2
MLPPSVLLRRAAPLRAPHACSSHMLPTSVLLPRAPHTCSSHVFLPRPTRLLLDISQEADCMAAVLAMIVWIAVVR